ncbi:MAG: choice-of-anchor D domain-containing protein, partial [Actinomycetota bacterium]|nr:choice-of-anchor D domain-containing protein [Actinomycetota bacterium]
MACFALLASGLVVAALALAAGSLSASPDALDFGSQDVDDGATLAQATTITNAGPDPVAINHLSLTGLDTDQFAFDSQPGDCDGSTVLNQGESCDVHLTFDPTATGAKSATLNAVPDPGDDPVTIDLQGTGTQTELTPSSTSTDFGGWDVDDGPGTEEVFTIANSGTEPVTIDAAALGGTDPGEFWIDAEEGTDCAPPLTLGAGQSCEIRVSFDPATTGAKTATITVDSDVPDIVLDLAGTGTQTELTAAPDSLTFGSQDVDDGSTAVQTSVVENTGTETVTFDARTLGGADALDFAHLTDQVTDCASTPSLGPGDTCNVRIRFDPDGTGAKSATLTLDSNAPDEVIALAGTGTQTQLTAEPGTLAFGGQDVDDGATAEQTSVVENTGTEPVDLDAVTVGGTDPGQFERLADQGTDCTAATTLNAGETCDVRVAFDPTATGAKSATVTIDSNAPDETVDLSGTGTQTELTADPDSLALGDRDVDDGASSLGTSIVENTGTEPVTLADVVIGGADAGDFSQASPVAGDCQDGTVLAAGEDCDVRIAFDPSTVGAKSATVTLDSSAPDETIDLSGTGTQTLLTATPATLPFGDRDVNEGPTATQQSTVTNAGTEPVSLVAVDATGDTAQFERLTGQGSDCSATTTLNAGDECTIRVRFDPTTVGAKSVTYTVDSNAADVTVDATGTGTLKQLSAGPVALPFGSQDVDAGPTPQQESIVQNTGDQDVTIAAVTLGGANPKQFQRITGSPEHCAPAMVLEPGDECDLDVVFDPSFKGAKSATVTVDSNAPDETVALTGTGIETVYESSDDPLDEAPVTNGQVNAVGFDSAGRTYLGGTFTSVGPRTGHGVELSETSDEPASGFPDVDGTIRAVVPDGSGGWFVGGDFTSVGGLPRARLAHILSSGAVDGSWDPAADGRVNALSLSDGNLYVGGEFATIDGTQRAFAAKVSASTGVLDATWEALPNNRVTALVAGGSGVHLGGDFTQVGGVARSRLARVSRSGAGALDEGWDPDANGAIGAIALSGTGDVYVGGGFTTLGGESRARIAKLSGLSGEPDPNWNPGASATVSSLAVSGSDVYAGGSFTTIEGEPRTRLAKLAAADGEADDAFVPDPNGSVLALAVTGAGVYAGGEFTQIGGQTRSRLARVST